MHPLSPRIFSPRVEIPRPPQPPRPRPARAPPMPPVLEFRGSTVAAQLCSSGGLHLVPRRGGGRCPGRGGGGGAYRGGGAPTRRRWRSSRSRNPPPTTSSSSAASSTSYRRRSRQRARAPPPPAAGSCSTGGGWPREGSSRAPLFLYHPPPFPTAASPEGIDHEAATGLGANRAPANPTAATLVAALPPLSRPRLLCCSSPSSDGARGSGVELRLVAGRGKTANHRMRASHSTRRRKGRRGCRGWEQCWVPECVCVCGGGGGCGSAILGFWPLL
jgi:hypothetical protein